MVLHEVTHRIGNLGDSVDDPGRFPCGERVQRDEVTALLFEQPHKLHVGPSAPGRVRIHRRQRSVGHVYNTSVWGSVELEIDWDPGRRRVEIAVTRTVDTST